MHFPHNLLSIFRSFVRLIKYITRCIINRKDTDFAVFNFGVFHYECTNFLETLTTMKEMAARREGTAVFECEAIRRKKNLFI